MNYLPVRFRLTETNGDYEDMVWQSTQPLPNTLTKLNSSSTDFAAILSHFGYFFLFFYPVSALKLPPTLIDKVTIGHIC